ncbi:hypothetical protein JXA32_02030 [Candidatus Sumerlaeota bacterium]|nr:hypothetical protein [Candidatus Sumerlaeota bacterium]
MNDTAREIDVLYHQMIMRLTPQERFRKCCDMFDSARAMAITGIKHEFGDNISEAELRKHTFLRFYGHDFPQEQHEAIIRAINRNYSTDQ